MPEPRPVVADPAFVQAPGGDWGSLSAPDYLAHRAKLIDSSSMGQRMKTAPAGNPGDVRLAYAPMAEQEEYGTSHISVVDAYGSALAMTTTIEDGWGSRLMVNRGLGLGGGFLLNNEMTDFSFSPADAAGHPIANGSSQANGPVHQCHPPWCLTRPQGNWF